MTVKIANSGSDERGQYAGGKAGDQTGTEWRIRSNYNRPWKRVLRLKDAKLAELLADLAEEAAANNKIGYDQWQRETFWAQLKKVGYRPKNIKVACEQDCSAGVCSLLKAVGYLKGVSKLKSLPITTTHYMRDILMDTGLFKEYTSSKYTDSDSEYLKRGDILLNDSHHTALVVSNGKKASSSTTTEKKETESKPASSNKKGAGTYKVTASDGLNVRTGDTVRFPIITTMKKGHKFKVLTVSENGWGYIPEYDGWASLKYAEKV